MFACSSPPSTLSRGKVALHLLPSGPYTYATDPVNTKLRCSKTNTIVREAKND